MTLINKLLLSLALLPRKLYQQWGIDVPQLKSILTYKLIMDDRRPNALQATSAESSQQKEINYSTIWTMITSFVMGLMFLFVFYLGSDTLTQFTLFFSMFVVFLCLTLVGDFTGVLIDVRESYIILPKPVNDRTVVLSRLLHIFVHLCKLVVPMCLPTFLYLAIFSGVWDAAAFLPCAVLAILLSIFLINAVYILILRVTTPQRFKNVISYIQIAFTIVVFGTYQAMPRMTDGDEFQKFTLPDSGWLMATPPYWLASLFQVITGQEADAIQYLAALLAIIVPIASIYVVVRYLAPAFNQKLAMISGSGEGGNEELRAGSKGQDKSGLLEKTARILTSNNEERIGFLFTWKMMLRSREYKLKVYPTIGYMAVLLALNLFRGKMSSSPSAQGAMLLFSIYTSILIVVIASNATAYSDKYKGAWIFLVTPISRPGELISGALKAVYLMFFSGIALLVLVLGVSISGYSTLPSLLFALSNVVFINYGMAYLNFRFLPFSASAEAMLKGSQTALTFMIMVGAGLLGLLHYFILEYTLVLWAGFFVSAFLVALLMYAIRRKTWEAILTTD